MSRKAQLKEGSARSGQQGFDHKTAADFLNGKTVSDEAVRTFVAASRWAHDERAALSATLLAMHGVLTSREAEIALLKKALLEAETATQQEAQAVVQDDLITIRKPTTHAEMLWLLKLAHLVISDVDKTLEETFAPAQRLTGAAQADSVPAVSDLPPLPAPDLRDVGTKPQEIKEFLKGYATEYARTAIAARAPAGAEESRTIPDREIPGIVEKALQELEGLVKYATSIYGHWDMSRAKGALSDLEWWARRKLAAHAQAADSVLEDAADPLQGAANWLAEAHGQFSPVVLSGCLMIGYNRAKRLHDAALAARKQGEKHDR